MDDPDEKYPGHTHMSFGVGSVTIVKKYFEEQGIAISGNRPPMAPGSKNPAAIFVRDPDGTVSEFERNDGGDDGIAPVTAAILSQAPRGGLDHIGTRVTNPQRTLQWYKQVMGFSEEIMIYERDENPRKNFIPWIVRTQHGKGEEVDINLIINGTTKGEPKNVMLSPNQDPLPGILYAAYVVDNLETALAGLEEPSNIARTPEELASWGIAANYVQDVVGAKSCFIRDIDHTVYRFLELV
jgi:catechol 2,3-dioxygenase-like lactoylglutathione lyase family enzyme